MSKGDVRGRVAKAKVKSRPISVGGKLNRHVEVDGGIANVVGEYVLP